MNKAVLVITDGIGYSAKTKFNAFHIAKKPNYDYLFANVPNTLIHTYGLNVGLPDGQMGNSEVGHMCIGSGRVLYQDLVKISKALESGEMAQNPALLGVLKKSKNIHIAGLMSDGGVHSHLSHFLGVAQICAQFLADSQNLDSEIWLHLITDGRDVLPTSALKYLQSVQEFCDKNPRVKIASVSGRFYAMDRDKRWERVKVAYDVITSAQNAQNIAPREYINAQYEQKITDEFINPASFNGYKGMSENDGFVFINFRSDRAREIVEALGNAQFSGFEREKFVNLNIATMCEYDSTFAYPIMFPKDKVQDTLAQVISRCGLRQLHTAETEKYAHVTFFLNGGLEAEFEGEKRVLIPSPNVKTYDLQPEMSAPAVGDAVVSAIDEGYDFVVVNFANGDMVGHTGNFEAAIKAVEAVDLQLGRIIESARKNHYALVITSDHGNCEEMKDEQGNILTNHTIGDVWAFVADFTQGATPKNLSLKNDCALNNIAPTILKLMELEIPKAMDEALF